MLADAPNEQLVNISRNWAGIDDITNHGEQTSAIETA